MHTKALKRYMKVQFINQSELASLLGVDRHQVSRWLSGQRKPALSRMRDISKKTGIPMGDLV